MFSTKRKTSGRMALIVFLGVLLAACGDDDDAEDLIEISTIQQLEQGGQIPTLDRSASLSGPDANSNGVRDDIDDYLDGLTYSAEQMQSLQQMARTFQATMSVEQSDPMGVTEASRDLTFAIDCVFDRFDGSPEVAAENIFILKAITNNTLERYLAYLALSEAMDGRTAEIPEGTTCV